MWTQNLNWTAPADGTYRVFGMWTQGTFQTSSPATEPSYATNYFDARGVEALKAFWEEHYLADPALVEKITKGDVQLFMDSLEMHRAAERVQADPHVAAVHLVGRGHGRGVREAQGLRHHPVPVPHRRREVARVQPVPLRRDITGTYRLDGAPRLAPGIINDLPGRPDPAVQGADAPAAEGVAQLGGHRDPRADLLWQAARDLRADHGGGLSRSGELQPVQPG